MSQGSNNIAEIFKAQAIMQSDNVIFSLIIFAVIDIVSNILKEIMVIVKAYIDKQMANLNKVVVTSLPTVSIEEAELLFNRPFKNSHGGDWDRADAVLYHALQIPLSSSILVIGSLELVQNRKRFEIESGIDIQIIELNIDVANGTVNQISFKLISKTKNICQLRDWVTIVTELYVANKKNGFGSTRYYFDQIVEKKPKNDRSESKPNLTFSLHKFTTNRTLDNVFHDRQEEITKRIKFFLNNQQWYNTRGIPYTFGMLLYGPPGTGKTSTIKAIANESDRHIININLGAIKTRNQLKKLFYDDRLQVHKTIDGYSTQTTEYIIPIDKRVYVLEDFDATLEAKFISKRYTRIDTDTESESDKDTDLDLATLLNVIDGTLETPGRILVLTSNHPEMIDEALIRPGRIDLIIEYGKCSSKVIVDMWKSFYGTSIQQSEFESCQNIWTPAQVGQILFRNFSTAEKALDELKNTKPFTFATDPTEHTPIPQITKPTDNTVTPEMYQLFLPEMYRAIHGSIPENNCILDILLGKPQIPLAHVKLMFAENQELTTEELRAAINIAYRFIDGIIVPNDFRILIETFGHDMTSKKLYQLIHAKNIPETYTYEEHASLPDLFAYLEQQ